MSDELEKWFNEVVDLLVAHGNRVVGERRWSFDKEGKHCHLIKPLDFSLIKASYSIPPNVILNEKYQSIATLNDSFEIKQRIPSQLVLLSKNNFKIPAWRPIVLKNKINGERGGVSPINDDDVKIIEKRLVAMGAQNVGKNIEVMRYVEPYKTFYRDHTWLIQINGRSIGVFIQATEIGVTTTRDEAAAKAIEELIIFSKQLIKDSALMIWNDQELNAVL